jgi:hypothetical protein
MRIQPSNTNVMQIRSIAIAGYIVGILFKILHWPGASIILVTSAVLTIGMLALLLNRKPGPMTVQLRLPAMLIGSVIAIITGGLFKTMHWPGANVLLMLGMIATVAWVLATQLWPAARPQTTA